MRERANTCYAYIINHFRIPIIIHKHIFFLRERVFVYSYKQWSCEVFSKFNNKFSLIFRSSATKKKKNTHTDRMTAWVAEKWHAKMLDFHSMVWMFKPNRNGKTVLQIFPAICIRSTRKIREKQQERYNFVMNFASYLQNIHFSSFVCTKMDFPIVVHHWMCNSNKNSRGCGEKINKYWAWNLNVTIRMAEETFFCGVFHWFTKSYLDEQWYVLWI